MFLSHTQINLHPLCYKTTHTTSCLYAIKQSPVEICLFFAAKKLKLQGYPSTLKNLTHKNTGVGAVKDMPVLKKYTEC